MQKSSNGKQIIKIHFIFFHPYLDSKTADDEAETATQSLLWVHQERWQRTMLCTYGNCVTLIDATYKTMRYDLPLFFVCVRTNVGYCVVAEFVTQSETAEAIQEALQVLKSWNPDWNPPFVLCDYSEAEIAAIEHTFPDTSVFLCDFHREQAWTRWMNTSHNGLSKMEADDLLTLLRKCAWAPLSSNKDSQTDGYVKAVIDLRASCIYKEHCNVRSWLESNWLNIPEVKMHNVQSILFTFCRNGPMLFVTQHITQPYIDTNNAYGTEALNKALKYSYLPKRKSLSLSGIASLLYNRLLSSRHVSKVYISELQII